jgi:hypothetical protein
MGSTFSNIFGGGAAPQLNGGNLQPSDINQPPTGTPGVLGVVPGTGADANGSSGAGSSTPNGPTPLQTGVKQLGAGINQGLSNYAQQQQQIKSNAKPVNITVPQSPAVNGYGVPQPLQVPTLFTVGATPSGGFYGG